MKYFFWFLIGVLLGAGLVALHLNLTANLRHEIKILSRSLENEFNEHYITKGQLADAVRVGSPPKYRMVVKKERRRR